MAMATRSGGVPTRYHETRFRSRLESRWAALFDLVEWPWVYEPFDTAQWIPDFLVNGDAPFLVEVGPCVKVADYREKAAKAVAAFPPINVYCERMAHESCRHADDFVISAEPERVTLVVGVTPLLPYFLDEVAGLLTGAAGLQPAHWTYCRHCARYAIAAGGIAFPCGHGAQPPAPGVTTVIFDNWGRAGNLTQWRPPRPRSA